MTTAICDAGPLIALAKLHQLYLLGRLHDHVLIPQAVYTEAVQQGMRRGSSDAHSIQSHIKQLHWEISAPQTDTLPDLPIRLGAGEQSAIALALHLPDSLLLIDDELARSTARQMGLKMRGTIGVLIEAYEHAFLTWDQTDLLLQEIASRSDIWIGHAFVERVRAHLAQTRKH